MKFPRGKVLLEQVDATYIGIIFDNCSASLQTFLETVSNTYRRWLEAVRKNDLNGNKVKAFGNFQVNSRTSSAFYATGIEFSSGVHRL